VSDTLDEITRLLDDIGRLFGEIVGNVARLPLNGHDRDRALHLIAVCRTGICSLHSLQ
jgi:hypothetical protein